MRVAISGASGFVGSALEAALRGDGDTVQRLVRSESSASLAAGDVRWDPATGAVDAAALDGADAVVHLAGENIAAGRWTARRKAAIRDSRGPATEKLCRALAALRAKPRVLVCASAVGVYGDRGDELLDDASAPGRGFLAEVTRGWEAATAPAAGAGIRVVNLRFGVVLHPSGGALKKMLPAFRLGIAGRLGSGRQWTSWLTRADAVAVIRHALADDSLHGPIVATAPEPVTNAEFTRALAKALHRPAVLPVPAFALRLLFGELADAALLASVRAVPRRLLAAGFLFEHPRVDSAFAALFAK